MSHRTAHIAKKLKGTATLLFLLFCVCSAVARDTTRVFSNLRWDNNGNLAQQTIYSVNNNVPTFLNMRMLFWDEDDRLNLVAGDGYLSYYAYGYDGNRAIKMTGTATIDQNGVLQNTSDLNNITIYPSEYLTVTQAEYTKYYYAGGNRIASKIGTGGFGKMQQLCTLDQNLTANANTLFDNVLQHAVNTTSQPTDEYPVDVCNGYNVATELLTEPLLDFYINSLNLNFTQNNLLQQFRQNLAGGTEPVYYFHSDHLGSASWITNNTGLPVQHLLYLPFGEHFANEHSSGYDERFTFTGKERDAETGYYYHGARFNSSDIGWLSVDPQFENLPNITPYSYCLWNPIILHDPDGEFPAFKHGSMVFKATKGKNIGLLHRMQMWYGASIRADICNQGEKQIHMDSYYPTKKVSQLSNYQNIVNRYNEAVSNYQNKISNENYHDAGIELHTIADFYSHSNYIELFDKYMNGKKFTADDIPTFSEVLNNPQYSGFIDILQAELHTGKYQNWIFDQVTSKDNSHKYMNHDNDKSISGRSEYHGTTGYDAAYKVALKDIINIMENKNE